MPPVEASPIAVQSAAFPQQLSRTDKQLIAHHARHAAAVSFAPRTVDAVEGILQSVLMEYVGLGSNKADNVPIRRARLTKSEVCSFGNGVIPRSVIDGMTKDASMEFVLLVRTPLSAAPPPPTLTTKATTSVAAVASDEFVEVWGVVAIVSRALADFVSIVPFIQRVSTALHQGFSASPLQSTTASRELRQPAPALDRAFVEKILSRTGRTLPEAYLPLDHQIQQQHQATSSAHPRQGSVSSGGGFWSPVFDGPGLPAADQRQPPSAARTTVSHTETAADPVHWLEMRDLFVNPSLQRTMSGSASSFRATASTMDFNSTANFEATANGSMQGRMPGATDALAVTLRGGILRRLGSAASDQPIPRLRLTAYIAAAFAVEMVARYHARGALKDSRPEPVGIVFTAVVDLREGEATANQLSEFPLQCSGFVTFGVVFSVDQLKRAQGGDQQVDVSIDDFAAAFDLDAIVFTIEADIRQRIERGEAHLRAVSITEGDRTHVPPPAIISIANAGSVDVGDGFQVLLRSRQEHAALGVAVAEGIRISAWNAVSAGTATLSVEASDSFAGTGKPKLCTIAAAVLNNAARKSGASSMNRG